jgi:hypothetical protein
VPPRRAAPPRGRSGSAAATRVRVGCH